MSAQDRDHVESIRSVQTFPEIIHVLARRVFMEILTTDVLTSMSVPSYQTRAVKTLFVRI